MSRTVAAQPAEAPRKPTPWKSILTGASGAGVLLAFLAGFIPTARGLVTPLYVLSILSGGIYVVRGAVRGLVRQRFLNIDFLVVLAAIGAMYIGELPEAAAVIFFFSLAEAFEAYGVRRSQQALRALLDASPQTATLPDGTTVPVEAVRVGARIVARPGDRVPLDGIVVRGESAIDESTITGEPLPQDKRAGDPVFAGTTNADGHLEIEVTKRAEDSTVARIVALVREAQRSKATAEEFIDRFAKYYTPAVVVLAIAVATLPPLVLGQPFLAWFTRALILLVIACPCALVIATPVAIASALGGASRRGVLIKGGRYLQGLQRVRAVAFDKTGTLTRGQPTVSDVLTFNGYSEQQVLEDAMGVEQFSSHPLSKSIVEFARARGIAPHEMRDYRNVAGKGGIARCIVCNDTEHCVGSLKLIGARNSPTGEILDTVERLERAGKTAVLVSEGSRVMGAIAIQDAPRKDAAEAVARLRGFGIPSIMLSGDNQHTAQGVGDAVGISEVHGSLLPEEKVAKVAALRRAFGSVAMVGDGINDAPSLALADVGIAMGSRGAGVAIETADVTLMRDRLTNVPYAIDLGRKTIGTVQINIGAALLAKVGFVVLAVLGLSNLGIAVAADSGVAILVILNGLRLFQV